MPFPKKYCGYFGMAAHQESHNGGDTHNEQADPGTPEAVSSAYVNQS